jgi:hypothetical protein
MNRGELESTLAEIFAHPVMKRRMENSVTALRRRNMDPETRGVVIGHLEILDYMRHRLVADLFPDDATLNFPQSAEEWHQQIDEYAARAAPPTTPEAERVAPLPRRVGWDLR